MTTNNPPAPPYPGRFVALEGPDGGGKTTQVQRLAESLRQAGHTVALCRDPGGTPLGDRLRSLLQDPTGPEFGVRAEMLLFMASRAQLVESVIRPALEAGEIVVSDRFLLSNVVYQGYAGGLDVEEIWTVGRSATGGLMPDLTLILDVPPATAVSRIGAAGRDRIEARGPDYRERVRQGFLDIAAHDPASIVVLDADVPPEALAQRIREEVTRALALDPRS